MLIYSVFGRHLAVKKTSDGWQVFRADMAERKFSRLYDIIIPDDAVSTPSKRPIHF